MYHRSPLEGVEGLPAYAPTFSPGVVEVGVVVCFPVQVFACAVFKEATTDPVVGLIVSVLSEFETELTAPPPPLPSAVFVPLMSAIKAFVNELYQRSPLAAPEGLPA